MTFKHEKQDSFKCEPFQIIFSVNWCQLDYRNGFVLIWLVNCLFVLNLIQMLKFSDIHILYIFICFEYW